MRLVERRVGVWLRTAAARLIAECGDPSCGQCGVTPILDGPAFNELREQHRTNISHPPFSVSVSVAAFGDLGRSPSRID